MSTTFNALISAAVVVLGVVLAVFFGDDEFFWFRGRPLGIVMAVIGAIELADYARKRSNNET